jgi:hypothetical protein
MKFNIIILTLLFSAAALAENFCGRALTSTFTEIPEVQNLKKVFAFQSRVFKQKNRPYLVFKANPRQINHPVYKKFQNESIEIIITKGGQFRHILLRVGSVVYSLGAVAMARVGEPFLMSDDKQDSKGMAFVVGEKALATAKKELEAFYRGSGTYNNPPYSIVGGKLLIIQRGNDLRFQSREHVWIPGSTKIDLEEYLNNRSFTGKIIQDVASDGKVTYQLENPYGFRMPISVSKDGQKYVYGFSCASSAVEIVKRVFGIDLFPARGSASLMKALVEGNNDFEETPDALILYGPEKKKTEQVFSPPEG